MCIRDRGGGIEALFVNPMEYTSVLGMIYKQTAAIKDAQVLALSLIHISCLMGQFPSQILRK